MAGAGDRRNSASPRDLLGPLVAARDSDGSALSRQEIRDEIATFLVAGHETIAMALTWSLALLSAYPQARQRLEEEVDAVLGDGPADPAKLPWTSAVISEAMRLYPPAWTLERIALADDDVCGTPVPAGSMVAVLPYLVHRNPAVWPNPAGFDPERFLPGAPERHRYAWLPFGGGKRGCIGAGFARQEAILVLARLCRHYRLDLAHPGLPRPAASSPSAPPGRSPCTSPAATDARTNEQTDKARPNHRGDHHAPAAHESHPRRRATSLRALCWPAGPAARDLQLVSGGRRWHPDGQGSSWLAECAMTVSRLRDIPGIGVDQVGHAADAAADPRFLRLENLVTDLRPPQVALDVTRAAISRDDANSYLPFQGHLALREAAAARVAAATGASYDPHTQCVSVAGGLNGIFNVLLATVEPGQEVVICDPVYAGLVNRIRLAGGVPRFVSCTPGPGGWATDPGELAAAIGPRTAAVLLMSPVMPTGAVLSVQRDRLGG